MTKNLSQLFGSNSVSPPPHNEKIEAGGRNFVPSIPSDPLTQSSFWQKNVKSLYFYSSKGSKGIQVEPPSVCFSVAIKRSHIDLYEFRNCWFTIDLSHWLIWEMFRTGLSARFFQQFGILQDSFLSNGWCSTAMPCQTEWIFVDYCSFNVSMKEERQ